MLGRAPENIAGVLVRGECVRTPRRSGQTHGKGLTPSPGTRLRARSAAGSSTHPPRDQRLTAVANGWSRADAMGDGRTDCLDLGTGRDDSLPRPQREEETQRQGEQDELRRRQLVEGRVVALFDGDPVRYYVEQDHSIVGLSPYGQRVLVGQRTRPLDSRYAWTYSTFAGVQYLVTYDWTILAWERLHWKLRTGWQDRDAWTRSIWAAGSSEESRAPTTVTPMTRTEANRNAAGAVESAQARSRRCCETGHAIELHSLRSCPRYDSAEALPIPREASGRDSLAGQNAMRAREGGDV